MVAVLILKALMFFLLLTFGDLWLMWTDSGLKMSLTNDILVQVSKFFDIFKQNPIVESVSLGPGAVRSRSSLVF